ncbi:MAG: hypothetical protein JOZ43_00860, partial [Acidobacteriales bacterium]|nr:hypothetical protein [Terriglobales bacterium]
MRKTIAGAICVAVLSAIAIAASADAGDIISFLNQTIEWRHQLVTLSSEIDIPGELIFAGDNQHAADQIAVLAFRYARAEAAFGVVGQSDESSSGSGSA